jgi:alkanesulfonate monooxygenase SsuD/methylene tetrahydromethanopterin reductase-like flavin-dependent oxidoreductase (luciferase family)
LQVSLEESRARLNEGLKFVQQAWLQPRLSFHSRFHHADDLTVIPRPVQQPHPPIKVAANTADTFRDMGAMGHRLLVAALANPPSILEERLASYREAAAGANVAIPDDRISYTMFVFAGAYAATVRSLMEPSLKNYWRAGSDNLEPEGTHPSKSNASPSCAIVLATPAMRKARRLRRSESPLDASICWASLRSVSVWRASSVTTRSADALPPAEIIKSMRLFAEKVMAQFA